MGSSSLTRDQTRTPCIESKESQPLDHQGSPESIFIVHQGPISHQLKTTGVTEQRPQGSRRRCRSQRLWADLTVQWQEGGSPPRRTWGHTGTGDLCGHQQPGMSCPGLWGREWNVCSSSFETREHTGAKNPWSGCFQGWFCLEKLGGLVWYSYYSVCLASWFGRLLDPN